MGLSSSKQQATATATATATTKPPNIDMDDTTNFFIIVIAVFMYFYLIGLVYIKTVQPQQPINWVLVMNFMLGLNNYDNFDRNVCDGFTTKTEGFTDTTKRIDLAKPGFYDKISKNISGMADWISLHAKRALVKLYIRENTFYNTQRINSKPLVML